MAKAEEAEGAPKKTSLVAQMLGLVLVTAIAVGGGWGFGQFVLGAGQHKAANMAAMPHGRAETPAAAEAEHDGEEGGEGHLDAAADRKVDLEPIVTNVSAPKDTWVRLEMSVLFDTVPEPETVQAIHQDIMAYMRAIKLHEVAGSSGYLHMRSDLKEVAMIRSGGAARDILIKVLLFE
ncbi:MAG: flagellar basal body-associated FliL family protein [Rhizobiaceae bacterium]